MISILTSVHATEPTLIPVTDALDPRKNKYWRGGSTLTVAEWMTFCEHLYTPANCLLQGDRLLPRWNQAMLNFIGTNLPLDKWKYLGFLSGEENLIMYYTPRHSRYWDREYFDITQSDAVSKFREGIAQIESFLAECNNSSCTAIAQCRDNEGLGAQFFAMLNHYPYCYYEQDTYSIGNLLNLSGYLVRLGSNPVEWPQVVVTSEDGRSHLYKVFRYNTDVTHMIPETIHMEKVNKRGDKIIRDPRDPLYGIELELSCAHHVTDIINSQEFPFFICKHDGSISGSHPNAYECVTVPMDYRSQRVAWGKFFARFLDETTNEYTGFDNSLETTNGMHIHITKKAFWSYDKKTEVLHDTGHLRRFTWFFVDPENNEFITAVSERGDTLGEYAKIPSFGRKSRKQAFASCVEACQTIRGAVNIRSNTARTIEVRVFKGIVSYATVLKNLEFVDAVFWFTQERSYQQLTLKHFLAWIETLPKTKYKALRLFLKGMDQGILNRQDTYRRLDKCKTEQQVLETVAEHSLHVDESVAVYLNARFGRRTNRSSSKPFAIRAGALVVREVSRGALREYEAQLNPFKLAA